MLGLLRRAARGRSNWRRTYWDVLESERWKQFRRDIIAETSGRCEVCGYAGGNRLQLHHRHYKTLGRERRRDVELLCKWCHKNADDGRVRKARNDRILRRFLPFPFRFF